jgi:mono/diheme cytochrome c family protein
MIVHSHTTGGFMLRPMLALALVSLVACGGTKEGPSDSEGMAGGEQVATATPTSFDPSTITEAEVALGDSVYHGLIGATSCQACHGANGAAGTAAPVLTDSEWLHSDGSFEGIYNTIKTGVMQPKQYSSVMPPFGGAPLDPQKHRAVAAYVYRLSHK